MALIVVEAEGPVHSEEVARRIREAFGLQKTGRRILDHVRSGLQHLLRNSNVTHNGEFWLAIGRDSSSFVGDATLLFRCVERR